jgi:nitrite reductase/ring-hydroxylating ferredoxin subunit/uncharacterized membrane protein
MAVDVKHSFDEGLKQAEGILDPLAEPIQNAISALIKAGGQPARNVKTFLNGTWLGHPLHPVLTDIPIGAWTTALVLDLAGFKKAADSAIGFGILGAVPTALAGLADWHDTTGQPRKVGMAHATFNSLALTSYVGSWFARKSGNRGMGIGLSTLGFLLSMGGAYLGGEIVYRLGTIVDRTAFDPETDEWRVAAKSDDLVEGKLHGGEITIDGVQVPIVLLKQGGRIHALHGRCSHMGGPLAEGKIVDRSCVECPWHGSTFDMADGTVVEGPSAFPQPYYEVRQREGNVEVRLAPGSFKHN